ncbi:retrotransposon protein, putative, ty1-copia subclass [Tanacetum coccineum]
MISSPSSVSHLSPTSQTSHESSNGQPSPVSTTSIPPPPPPPPLITRQRLAYLRQNPKQQVPYNPSANHATIIPTTITKPTSFTVVNNSLKWRQAMKEEYDALIKNGTWSLVPRASNTNVVDGFDFHETFSPVVKSTSIQAILSLAVTNNWPLRQLDVHNAFLHENLKEQVYMKQPPGFINPQRPNHVDKDEWHASIGWRGINSRKKEERPGAVLCMSTRSSSTDLFPPSSDPESIIRNRQRNLGD